MRNINHTRIIGAAACICMLFSMIIPSVHAQTEEDENLLFACRMGLISTGKDGNSAVTRYELAELMSRLVLRGAEASELADPGGFTDIDITYSSKIMPAVNFGIMHGISDTEFAPDSKVTYAELATAMTALLGYAGYAENDGGYPYGYIRTAVKLGIAPETPPDINASITYNALAYSFKAAVNVNVMERAGYVTGETYKLEEKEPFLEYYLNIYRRSGVVESTFTADISGKGTTDYDSIRMDGETYRLPQDMGGLRSCTGYSADIYYTEDLNGDYNILYYELRKNNTFDIDCTDLKGLSGAYIEYEASSGRTKRLKISAQTAVIFNNTLCTSYDAGTINPFAESYMDGSVRMIDNDNDAVYDVVMVEAYETYVIDRVSNGRIYNKYRKPDIIDLSDYREDGEYVIVNIEGAYLRPEDLAENDVLSVQRDTNGNIKRITVSIDSYTGTVNSVDIDDGIYSFEINGTKFDASPCLNMNEQLALVKVGNEVKVYFNKSGKICDIECGDYIVYKYGYVVSALIDEFDETALQLKLFTSGGKMTVFDVAEKVLVNEKEKIERENLLSILGIDDTGRIIRQPVRYMLNDSGEIKSIYYCSGTDSTKDGFYRYSGFDGITPISDYYYRDSSGTFGAKLLINDKTVIFSVPVDAYRNYETLYQIFDKSYFQSGTQNSPFEAYGAEANNPRAEMLVIKNDIYDFSTSELELYRNNPDVMVVSKVKLTVDEDNVPTAEVSGMCGGLAATYPAEPEAIAVKTDGRRITTGDIIRFYRNPEGRITLCQQLYDAADESMRVANPTSDTIYKFARFAYGTAVYADEEAVSIEIENSDRVESYLISSFNNIVLYDKTLDTGRQIITGSADDIRSRADYGNPSKIFVHTRNGDNRTLVIINE